MSGRALETPGRIKRWAWRHCAVRGEPSQRARAGRRSTRWAGG